MRARAIVLSTVLASVFGLGCIVETTTGPGTGVSCGNSGQLCCTGNACSSGLVCSTSGVCVVGPTGRAFYEACGAGEACAGGTCLAVGFTASGSGNLCTQACASQADCPGGGLCVGGTTGGNTCYRTCPTSSSAECLTGTVCRSVTDITGQAFNICVPGTGGTTLPNPYQLCTPVGGTCAGGTTCMATNTGGQPQCTRICPRGDARMCPGYAPGAVQQVVECANLTGNPSMFQCVRLCNSGTDADCVSIPGTRCRQVLSGTGAMLFMCIP